MGSINNKKVITRANKTSSIMCQLIQEKKLDDIKLLLKNGVRVNAPIIMTEPFAGYTALHMACMGNSMDLVKLLVKDFHADVNVVADDGIQPIHLACLFDRADYLRILVEANANIDAELSRDIIPKFVRKTWPNDFSDKVTILTYAILYKNSLIANYLLSCGANFKNKSLTNKTLLMYALENHCISFNKAIIQKLKDREFINARDDDGFPATHYLLHPKNYGSFRYCEEELDLKEFLKGGTIRALMECGADIDATINGDPDTLLLNMAAYRSSASMLRELLPRNIFISKSKALYIATLPFEDFSQSSCNSSFRYEFERSWDMLQEQRKKCTQLILKDLVNRRTFGLPVPEEEKQLMDDLIATDTSIEELVHTYEKLFINGVLKNKVIKYGDKSMTHYDFILQCVDDKKLQLLVKDQAFLDSFKNNFIDIEYVDHLYFRYQLEMRIEKRCKRNELLNKLKKIPQLTKVILLPYKFILNLIRYLNNEDLERLIEAFIKN